MRTSSLIITGVLLLTVVGAAVPARASDNVFFGTGIGAALGGLFGSQIGRGGGQVVATGVGVAVGGLIGNEVGHSMDESESQVIYSRRSPVVMYSDPAPIAYGAYAPNYVAPPAPPPIYVDQQARTYCRQYSQEIRIAGRVHESYGTACLQPDGSWRIVQ